jgi:hypothetical protein
MPTPDLTTIYDSVSVAAIPADATAVLAYVDGRYANLTQVAARFPHARILTVTVTGSVHADVADVEAGDLTPQGGAAVLARGVTQCLYSSVATLPALKAAVGHPFAWFAADWTGTEHLVPGSVATQWAAPGHGSPGNYDISSALTSWLYPQPSPKPQPPEEDDMQLFTTNTAGVGFIVAADLSHKQGLPSGTDRDDLLETGLYRAVTLSDALIDAIPG